MKILVVGSKGFIGSHAYSYFSKQKEFSCWGCDVVVDYEDPEYLLLDATNSDFFEVFEHSDFDVCINCSGAASVPDSIKNPFRDYTLNTFNVIKILEAIRRHSPACKFINISSAAVYGNPHILPISENNECNPISPYGKHKVFAEELCDEYYRFFGIGTCSLRVFSAYGPGLKKQLLWDIFQKSRKGNKVVLFGTGNETRDYIFVDDIISSINIIIKSGRFDAAVYNIANGIEISVKEVAVALLNALSFNGEITFTDDLRSGDPLNWRADIKKISDLGYQPAFTMTDGIKEYVKWLEG